MKFKLSTTGFFYTAEQAEKLAKLGFSFKERSPSKWENNELVRSQVATPQEPIEFSSLEELMAFCKEWGGQLILETWSDEELPRLKINDDEL